MYLEKNMSPIDRIIRILAGLVLTYIGFFSDGITHYLIINILIGVLGVINIISSLLGSCPVYTIVGINSCKKVNSIKND